MTDTREPVRRPSASTDRLARIGSAATATAAAAGSVAVATVLAAGALAVRIGRGSHRFVHQFEPWGIVLTLIGVAIALITIMVELEDRQAERIFRAWQVVLTVRTAGSSQREAVEYLNREFDGRWCSSWMNWVSKQLTGNNRRECLIPKKARESLVGIEAPKANLRDVDLTFANLRDATLADADLTSAILPSATLTDADLRSAILTDANPARRHPDGRQPARRRRPARRHPDGCQPEECQPDRRQPARRQPDGGRPDGRRPIRRRPSEHGSDTTAAGYRVREPAPLKSPGCPGCTEMGIKTVSNPPQLTS